jgi:hypothetical protein
MNYELKKLDDIEDFTKLVFNIEEEEDYKKLINKYKTYYDRLNLLNISNEEELNTYKKYIEDDYILKSYFSSISLFKTSDYILKKLNEKKSNGFDIKITNTVSWDFPLISGTKNFPKNKKNYSNAKHFHQNIPKNN